MRGASLARRAPRIRAQSTRHLSRTINSITAPSISSESKNGGICVRSISSIAKIQKGIAAAVKNAGINEVRSPKCRGVPCNWPNPCPCFPMGPSPSKTGPVFKMDHTAALLSSAAKERMYQLHKQDPEVNSVDALAAEYRIRKQRVLAILWLKEMEKQEEAKRGAPLDDTMEKLFESLHQTYSKAQRGEKHVPDVEIDPKDLNGRTPQEALEEISAIEERILVDEFIQRMEYNKKFLSGEITHVFQLEKPDKGWNYSVEVLDEKRGRTGGRRFISEPDGTHRTLNETERMRVRREKVLPRKNPKYILKPGTIGSLIPISQEICARHNMPDLTLGVLRGSQQTSSFRIWHAVRDWPPGRVYVHPKKDKTVGKMVKAVPSVKAFRTRSVVDRPLPVEEVEA